MLINIKNNKGGYTPFTQHLRQASTLLWYRCEYISGVMARLPLFIWRLRKDITPRYRCCWRMVVRIFTGRIVLALYTALHTAIAEKQVVIKMLLAHGVNTNLKTALNVTPLQID
jgi:hypothetical protein